MNYIKQRISIFLCMLMVFTTAFAAIPVETQAATTTYTFYDLGASYSNAEVLVYKGVENLYIGDYITAYSLTGNKGKYLGYLSNVKKVTYTSSNKSVATIHKSTGLVTTKKAGTTTITVKLGSTTKKIDLTVKSVKDYFNTYAFTEESVHATDLAAKAFLKEVGQKPTIKANNRYKILSAYLSYDDIGPGYYTDGDWDADGRYKTLYYITSPTAGRAYVVRSMIEGYIYDYTPFTTTSAKCFQVKSIAGKGGKNTIDLTLKKKVTDDQIFGAQTKFSWDSDVKKVTTCEFPMMVQDTSTGHKYYAIATIKKNSNKMTIELMNTKLVKGRTYKLVSRIPGERYDYGDWVSEFSGNPYTFKAK